MTAAIRAMRPDDAVEHPLPAGLGTCFVVRDFLSAAECDALVAAAESRGYGSAATDYPPSYRDNERQVVDDAALAQRLFERLRGRVPSTLDADGSTWRLCALNERLRHCRYRAGQQFRIHQDGVHHRDGDRRSLLTFMIYLDGPERFDGGDTVFYADGPRAAHGAAAPPVVARVRPRRGSVIVFDHALWHAGEPLTRGCKHIVRSDLIYEHAGMRTTTEPAPFEPGHRGYVWTLQRLADGRVASAGRDCAIRLWSRHGAPDGVLRGHERSVLGLAEVAPDRLASVSRDRRLALWNLADGRCIRAVVAHDAAALCVQRMAHDRLATGGADHAVALWNADGDTLARLAGHRGWVWSLAALGSDALASASEDGDVRVWSLHDAARRLTLRGPYPLRSIAARAIGDDAYELAAGDERGRITRWSLAGGRAEPLATFQAHAAAVRRLRYLADGRLASGGEDQRLRVWNAAAAIYDAEHANFVTDVAELDAGRLLSCSYDGTLRTHETAGLSPLPLLLAAGAARS